MTATASCEYVLVVEDQADVRAWLGEVAATVFPGAAVSACASRASAQAWLDAHAGRVGVGDGPPRLVALIDLGLPDGSGIDLVRRLAAHGERALPVVVTIFDDDARLYDAIAAGAQGYLLKEHAADTMARYLRRIHQGEPPLTPRIARRILGRMQQMAPRSDAPAEAPVSLTPRETEVLGIIARGMRIPETAQVLGLTDSTVASYVKIIYRKLNISSRAEAALEAARRKLV